MSEFAAAVSATEAETVAPEAADKAAGALVRNGANMRNRAAAIPARTTIPAAALYAAGIKGRVAENWSNASRLTRRNFAPHSASGVVCRL